MHRAGSGQGTPAQHPGPGCSPWHVLECAFLYICEEGEGHLSHKLGKLRLRPPAHGPGSGTLSRQPLPDAAAAPATPGLQKTLHPYRVLLPVRVLQLLLEH